MRPVSSTSSTDDPTVTLVRKRRRHLPAVMLASLPLLLAAAITPATASAATPSSSSATSSSSTATASGSATSTASRTASATTASSTSGSWAKWSVTGTDANTIVTAGGLAGGALQFYILQKPGSGGSNTEPELTLTVQAKMIATEVVVDGDSGLSPKADADLGATVSGETTTLKVGATTTARELFFLPEAAPRAAKEENQGLLDRTWEKIKNLITGDDDEDEASQAPATATVTSDSSPSSASSSTSSSPSSSGGASTSATASGSPTSSGSSTSGRTTPTGSPTGRPTGAATGSPTTATSSTSQPTSSTATSAPTSSSSPSSSSSASAGTEGLQVLSSASGLPFEFGASGEGVANGTYAKTLGRDLDVSATWANSNTDMVNLYTLQPGAEFGSWDKPLDVAIGAIEKSSGESWAKAAAGAYDAHWEQSAKNLEKLRGSKGWVTYVRFAHEWNGNWYPWSVTSGETEDFKKAWARFADILHTDCPTACSTVMSQNRESVGYSGDWTKAFPGADSVDILSVDYYNQNPFASSLDDFTKALDAVDGSGGPKGLGAHLAFAQSVGVPLGISEWSGVADQGDGAGFIEGTHDFLIAHAGAGGGQLLYAVQFNVASQNAGKFQLLMGGSQPKASQEFQELFGLAS